MLFWVIWSRDQISCHTTEQSYHVLFEWYGKFVGIWGPWKCGHTWSNPFRWLTNQIIYCILITSCQINEWFSKYLVYKYTWRDWSRFMLFKLKAMVWPFLEPTCGSLVGYNHSIPELVEEQSLQETTIFNGKGHGFLCILPFTNPLKQSGIPSIDVCGYSRMNWSIPWWNLRLNPYQL